MKRHLKKVSMSLLAAMSSILLIGAVGNASKGTKTASNSFSQYSWCGLRCYTMGVEGNYHSNGKKIDRYSSTKAVTSTCGTWSAHDKSASWIYKGSRSGDVKAYTTFKNGLCTSWFSLAIQTQDESCQARAYR